MNNVCQVNNKMPGTNDFIHRMIGSETNKTSNLSENISVAAKAGARLGSVGTVLPRVPVISVATPGALRLTKPQRVFLHFSQHHGLGVKL